MKLHTIDTGLFKLDGGAMFGVVPKTIWNKLNPADDNNMISMAMRCLLIEDGNQLILIDNGIGNKQDEKFFSHYYLHGDATLEKSLNKLGFSPNDITDMLLTHLHFDHCGGSINWNNDKTAFEAAFKNANYWVGEDQWHEALKPNAREKASFLKDNILPIEQSGQLNFINEATVINPNISFKYTYGHTNGMVHPIIKYKGYTIMYMADLVPTQAHLPIPYVMGYDTKPLNAMAEKEAVLKEAADNSYILFFEHDPTIEACTVMQTEKGVHKQNNLLITDL
ncbi:MAG: MBL fold metallo-hydrolase [Bacteroidia bacterium]|nr:MBL fold metallo-hydrolase [Bacteroidia bacterium]MBP9688017.1 MBL fold metallo-hydrolase [Bacteroidia bacterium]